MSSAPIPVPPPFTSVADVVRGLAAIEGELIARRDPRAAFAIAYLASAQKQERWLHRGEFLQRALVSNCVVVFANAYRDALARYESGDARDVPAAWRQSFGAGRDRTLWTLQHLLLGINAHINHDLPYAVLNGGLNVRCPHCYHDYRRMDDALQAAIPTVRGRLAGHLEWPMRIVNAIDRGAVDAAVAAAIASARRRSWMLATALDTAATPAARSGISAFIGQRAAQAGRCIVDGSRMPSRWLSSLYAVSDIPPAE